MMKEDLYRVYAEVVRSDQMSGSEVIALFKDEPGFADWYRKKYLDEKSSVEKIERWAERNPKNSWVQDTALLLIRKLTSVANCRK